MDLKMLEFDSIEDFKRWKDDFNKETAKVYNNALQYYMSLCNSDAEKEILSDWWNGECVSANEYKPRFNKKDYDSAHNIILAAISMGFG